MAQWPRHFMLVTLIVISEIQTAKAGLECMSCTNSASVRDCQQTTIKCGDDEECYLEKRTTSHLSLSYSAGCRKKAICNIMASLGSLRTGRSHHLGAVLGKRDLLNCAYCCSTEMDKNGPCNVHLCS
ncbi:uncharacterized protein LOC134231594 [Saccostrea cucullata]|uniref:uncharacterized protein LOC134231594 n=1 Tax=Saccostrea cuccullata TaxID=36930 RepID=UPI002ED66EF7